MNQLKMIDLIGRSIRGNGERIKAEPQKKIGHEDDKEGSVPVRQISLAKCV